MRAVSEKQPVSHSLTPTALLLKKAAVIVTFEFLHRSSKSLSNESLFILDGGFSSRAVSQFLSTSFFSLWFLFPSAGILSDGGDYE